MIDQDHPLAELLDILHVVTGQERHDFVAAVVLAEKLADFFLTHHVESDRRLVEKEYLRAVQERGDQLHLHPLPETEFPDHHPHLVADIEKFGQLIDRLRELLMPDPVDRAVEFQRLARGEIPPEGILLPHQQGELPLQLHRTPRGIESQHRGASRRGLEKPREHLEHRGLSRAVRSEKADKLPLPNGKTHRISGLGLRVLTMEESLESPQQPFLLPVSSEDLSQIMGLDDGRL